VYGLQEGFRREQVCVHAYSFEDCQQGLASVQLERNQRKVVRKYSFMQSLESDAEVLNAMCSAGLYKE
jgi:hypothetical protein